MGAEAIARALGGTVGLGESPSHDYAPVDRLHAVGAAQMKRGETDKAARDSLLASLGIDLVRLKMANVASAYEPCKVKLSQAIMWRGDEYKIKFPQAELIAAQSLTEFIIDFCEKCSGRGEVQDDEKTDGRDGIVPMKTCPTCKGTRVRKWDDTERAVTVGSARRLDSAFSHAHRMMSLAVSNALWNVRWLMK